MGDYGERFGVSGNVSLNIDYFDPKTIPKNSVLLIIGRRGTGKSTLAKDIMSYHTDIPMGFCICKTNTMNDFWTPHIPQKFIHHEYNQSLTYKILEHQEHEWQKHKKQCERKGVTAKVSDIKPAFAIYDDVTFDKSFLKDAATRELFMNGRHYNILVVITCQWMMDMDPGLRTQVDYVFMLKDNKLTNKKRMHEYFAGAIDHYSVFNRVFTKCTENRESLVLFNNSPSAYIPDSVFFYKAKVEQHYKLGCNDYWVYHPRYKKLMRIGTEDNNTNNNEFIGMSTKQRKQAQALEIKKQYPREIDTEKNNDSESDDDPVSLFFPRNINFRREVYKPRKTKILDTDDPDPKKIVSKSRIVKRKIKTDMQSDIVPIEPFGTEHVSKKEFKTISKKTKKKRTNKSKSKSKRGNTKTNHIQKKSTRQRAVESQLFLY